MAVQLSYIVNLNLHMLIWYANKLAKQQKPVCFCDKLVRFLTHQKTQNGDFDFPAGNIEETIAFVETEAFVLV